MKDDHTEILRVDPEFQWLIQPLEASEMEELEEDLFDHGCKTPIKVWDGLVIDGHKRVEICNKWGLEFKTEPIEFPDRAAAMEYICNAQLKRGDLTDEYFRYLIGKKYAIRLLRGSEMGESQDALTMRIRANKNRGMLQKYADETGFAIPTVRKYWEYSDALDAIKRKQSSMAAMILTSKLKMSHESTVEISRLPRDEVQYIFDAIKKDGKQRLRYNEIHDELRWRYANTSYRGTRKKEKDPEIRKMPKYDPDSEISSLFLTIPSWISSMERAAERTNFEKVTVQAAGKLKEQLLSLQETVTRVRRCLEEG